MRAALLIARIDNEEVEAEPYLREVERIAADITASLPKVADEKAKLAALDKHLFETLGYHGSRVDYYSKSNSYLNEVIDDREGLPITLSILYIEVARRVGLKLEGVGLPGHFIVRFAPQEGNEELIDVFDNGKRLTREEATRKVREVAERPPIDDEWKAQSKRAVITRMVQNLLSGASETEDAERMASYAETLVALNPDSVAERWYRAVALFRVGRIDEAQADADWLLARDESALKNIVEAEQVHALKRLLDAAGK
jgi:regulator of sirC expression with transglutaminase-like and TPR domain